MFVYSQLYNVTINRYSFVYIYMYTYIYIFIYIYVYMYSGLVRATNFLLAVYARCGAKHFLFSLLVRIRNVHVSVQYIHTYTRFLYCVLYIHIYVIYMHTHAHSPSSFPSLLPFTQSYFFFFKTTRFALRLK